jgi:CDP-glycerol glycerophosphotransferase
MKNIIMIFQNIVIKILSLFFLKSNKIVILGSRNGDTFLDNPRYLYLYLSKNKSIFNLKKVFWVTSDILLEKELSENGLSVLRKGSLKSIFYHLKAQYHIVDQSENEIDGKFSIGATRIKLWHGIPLKKIGTFKKQSKIKSFFYKKIKSIGFWNDSYILSPSIFTDEIFMKAFEVDKNNIISGGYPRNDVFFNDYYVLEKEKIKYKELIEKKYKGNKILFYLPTFRDNYDFEFLGEGSTERLQIFLKFLEKENMTLVVKPHPHNPFSLNDPKIIKLEPDVDCIHF